MVICVPDDKCSSGSIANEMDKMAAVFFKKCDIENKGFIVKEDLLRLHDEIQLDKEELKQVFYNLDVRNEGVLTLEGFTEAFLHYRRRCFSEQTEDADNSEKYLFESSQDNISSLRELLYSYQLERSVNSFILMQKKLKHENNTRLLTCWMDFQENLYQDLAIIQKQFQAMQVKLKNMEQHLNDYVTLHEQTTEEIEDEKNKAIMQERKRSAEKRFALTKKLLLQDRQLLEMSEYKRDLLQKLSYMFKKKDQYKKNKAMLMEQQELQLEEIERQKEMISQLENQFEAFKLEMTKECKRCFEEGFSLGKRIARIEEKGLLEELEILKEISHSLKGVEALEE